MQQQDAFQFQKCSLYQVWEAQFMLNCELVLRAFSRELRGISETITSKIVSGDTNDDQGPRLSRFLND